ncbi:LptA/OstA family protein [Dongia deserti]|uniref:LptA/OstA family protein n=1 Tax=Dongia deserti TaxID=2268030 RepID=UPI000E654EB4|nr:LptA/OstA family protein [Dongia deserti]
MSPNGVTIDSTAPASRWSLARLTGAIAASLILVLASSSWAQETGGAASDSGGGGFGFDDNDKDPIEISAENGIEWKRDARTYTARGNALAKQGDTSIAADTLVAYLDEQDELARWEAFGNVKIVTGQSTSYGDYAEYKEAQRLLVLTGKNLKVVTEEQRVTARDQIEYWRDKDVVVAKGNVVIVRPKKDTTIHSDEATAFFRDKADDPATPENEADDGQEVYQVDARGHVRVDRKDQTAFSDRLAYNPETEIAILTGNVVIHSKDNVYRGGRAELDLKNDVSRLLPAQGQRVFTTIKPKDKDNGSNTGTPSAPVTQ